MYQKYLINPTAEERGNNPPPFIVPLLMLIHGANRSAQSQ
jgi:hypothetical protein